MTRDRTHFPPFPRHPAAGWVVAGLGICLAWGATAAQPFSATNLLRKDFWDADGAINTIATANGVVYVGGSFSYVAPQGRKVASIDAYTGQTRPEFPQIPGSAIRAILDDGSGGWFVGGEFHQVGGLPRTNLVHVLGNNAVDPDFRPDPDGAVFALASDGETLYVGGDFLSIGGQGRAYLASISLSNGLVTAWSPQPDGRVSALLPGEDRIYAGGYFASIGGRDAEFLAALDPQSGGAFPWFPLPDGAVLTMGLLDRRLFVGGSFSKVGGALRDGAAAVDVQTGEATPWDPQPAGGDVTTLRAVCDTVYLGGYFTNVHGAARHRVAAVDSDLGLPSAWDAGLSLSRGGNLGSYVLALELSGDALYIGGDFEIPGNPLRRDLAAVDTRTARLLPWNPNLDGGVSALAVAGRTVLAGFVSAPGGVERRNLAAFDALTGRATGWDPAPDASVLALAVSGNTVFAGGTFTNLGGLTRTRLAAIDAATGLALPGWNPAANNSVFALALGDNILYVGGTFTSLGGQVRQRLGAIDATTGQVLPNWFANADSGSVRALALSANSLYVGGSFSALRGTNLNHLGALDPATGQVKTWNPGADDTVLALAVSGNTIFAGGDFNAIAGQSRAYLAAIDALSGQPTAWNPGADAEVFSLAISGGTIYAGGAFTSLGGQPRFGIAAVDASGSLLDWNPGTSPGNRVFALAVTEEGLFAGGTSLRVQDSASLNSLAVFPRIGAPVILAAPRDQNVPAGQDASFQVVAGGEPSLSYQWRFNGVALTNATSATLLLTNAQLAQSGSYEVIVSNALGGVTAEASLTVLVPVTIAAQPSDFIGVAGSNLVLAVSATGNPPPIYQWRLNGANIPGAVFPTLTLSNLTATGGGSYQVAIANGLGGVVSRVARVVFDSPPLAFADDFAARGTFTGSSGLGSGNNTTATVQSNPDEPTHAGKAGGKSVWLRWIAPASGIATFDTRGSGFDTLLGIYTGNSLSNLATVSGDEDRGGFLTSRAVFNVTDGVEYSVAVDGLAGVSGDIVLRWELDTSTGEFPRILTQPESQTVPPGGTAQFSVFATSATSMTFQWFFGCQAIPGATNSSLTIPNAQRRNVGNYRVFVMNASARVAESLPAALELGPQLDSRSFDKLEDLLAALRQAGFGPFAPASGGLGGDPVLVGMGSIVSQTFNTSSNTTSLPETNHCGVLGGHSTWLAFKPASNGVVQVNTIGSVFDTVLAVYRDTNLLTLLTNPAAALVTCDNNGAPDGTRSLLRFDATGGTVYLAVVDGVNGERGLARINWGLGLAPAPLAPVSNQTTQAYGSSQTLTAGMAGGIPPPAYQWRLNGTNLPGATSSNLVLGHLDPAGAGAYSVVLSNSYGMATNLRANLVVDVPLHLETWPWPTNRQFTFRIMGNTGQRFAVQASADLKQWLTIHTNRLTNWLVPFLDPDAPQFNQRFYRVIPSLTLEQQLIRTGGSTTFRVTGRASQPFVLEAASSWSNWMAVYTNTLPDVPMDFLDPQPAVHARRFYRARVLWP